MCIFLYSLQSSFLCLPARPPSCLPTTMAQPWYAHLPARPHETSEEERIWMERTATRHGTLFQSLHYLALYTSPAYLILCYSSSHSHMPPDPPRLWNLSADLILIRASHADSRDFIQLKFTFDCLQLLACFNILFHSLDYMVCFNTVKC